ncbi:MAG: (2Fe-2S)-binding protein, partial [Eubacteriales bacterium]|nr:(2Fe-2S)-binding protein [Eubacteriales bacterium]
AYGRIICRCESVPEAEILEAIRRPLGATTLDGVKRRARAGMGRCQGGFCAPRVLELLSRELGVPQTELTKFGGASRILSGTLGEMAEPQPRAAQERTGETHA